MNSYPRICRLQFQCEVHSPGTLGVHTNTVYFRLNRLKKISDLDPRSYAGTSTILTALRLLEIRADMKAP